MSALAGILRRVFRSASRRAATLRRRSGGSNAESSADNAASSDTHADERTIRRIAEHELGGTSSAESREAYLRGENPGGLHQGGHGPAPRARGKDDEPAEPLGDTLVSAPSPGRH
jgi:hypothetical protein